MAKVKEQFYLTLSATMLNDAERFQNALMKCYTMGIEPIDYVRKTVVDTESKDEHGNDIVVMDVILVKCQQRWRGAMKRFLRKCGFEYLNDSMNNLPIFG